MTLEEMDDTFPGGNGDFFFFAPRSREREIVYFDVLESWKGRGIPVFYCVWALWARYFSLPLAIREPGWLVSEIVRRRRSPNARCQKRDCSSLRGARKQTRAGPRIRA